MAGGIDWFRWHHGSVTDPKFQLVAKRAAASVAEVIAVWASLLEAASMAEDRGNPGQQDFEAIDCALGIQDGKALAIYTAMQTRSLVEPDGRVAAWVKRQPKREREDDTAAERKRQQRARDASTNGVTPNDTPPETTEDHVTPRHTTSHQKTPREEKRREEEKEQPKTKTARKRAAASRLVSVDDLAEDGVDRETAADWLAIREEKNLPLTLTAWSDTKSEAIKAGLSSGEAVRRAAAEGWAGFKANWTQKGQGPPSARVNGHHNRQEALEASNSAVAARWLAEHQDAA